MDTEDLFIQSLEDLHYSLACSDRYEVLRASHLIRQLLLDGGNSLVTRVNRTHHLKIAYPAAPLPEAPSDPTATWFAGDALAVFNASTPPAMVKWAELEKTTVARCEGHEYTVHDIIDYSAHVAGGVHKTDPSDDRSDTGHRKILGPAHGMAERPGSCSPYDSARFDEQL